MNAYQKTAIERPCYFSIETAHPRYGHVIPAGTLVLTVNSGYE